MTSTKCLAHCPLVRKIYMLFVRKIEVYFFTPPPFLSRRHVWKLTCILLPRRCTPSADQTADRSDWTTLKAGGGMGFPILQQTSLLESTSVGFSDIAGMHKNFTFLASHFQAII